MEHDVSLITSEGVETHSTEVGPRREEPTSPPLPWDLVGSKCSKRAISLWYEEDCRSTGDLSLEAVAPRNLQASHVQRELIYALLCTKALVFLMVIPYIQLQCYPSAEGKVLNDSFQSQGCRIHPISLIPGAMSPPFLPVPYSLFCPDT